jgi:hypothetical protein
MIEAINANKEVKGMKVIKEIAVLLTAVVLAGSFLIGCGGGGGGGQEKAAVGTAFQYNGREGHVLPLDSQDMPEIQGGALWFNGGLYVNVKGKGIMKASIHDKKLAIDQGASVITRRLARDMSTDGKHMYITNYYHTYGIENNQLTGLVTREYGNFIPVVGGTKAYIWMENQPFREVTLVNGQAVTTEPSFLQNYSQFPEPVHSLQDGVADSDNLYLLGTYTDTSLGALVSSVYAFKHDGTYVRKYGNSDTNQPDCIAEGHVMALTKDYVLVSNDKNIFVFQKNDGHFVGKIVPADLGNYLSVHQILPMDGNQILLWYYGTIASEENGKKLAGQAYDEGKLETGDKNISQFSVIEL